tara:strand:+ start:2751 stop:4481 length:1731 start_codon:yes stop_codon:yes gene_type:complete
MSQNTDKNTPYRVLALKYRPQNFDELIGQDALVRTLRNAIETGRIAHAFMLTGVRGVGKTTTARIIAKALNYRGPEGTSDPTTGPTDDCDICKAIAEDRHPDVIEMDAATRTGVDDIREILDGVRYAPTEARYKVYIIDEVHMLSKQAFNALLKTLEEPPPHVKFIFATTEIRKVPITVLSRCQRFDLRRVDVETLMGHFQSICEKETVSADDAALSAICRAADGSVRDGLSLLDQAIALSDGHITAEQVKTMLGLGDRSKNLDLLEHVLSGNVAEALDIMDDIYKVGGDPSVLIQDLLDLVHQLTKLRAVPKLADQAMGLTGDEQARVAEMAAKLSMPTLGKAWQILLKGLNEVNMAVNPQSAAEMVVIRLSYSADLPDPSDLLRKLSKDGPQGAPVPNGGAGDSVSASSGGGVSASRGGLTVASSNSGPVTGVAVAQQHSLDTEVALSGDHLRNLEDIIAVLEEANEMVLAGRVYQMLHLVRLENKGDTYRLEVRPQETAPHDLLPNLSKILRQLTGKIWMISPSQQRGQPTLAEKAQIIYEQELDRVKNHPLMKDVYALFPDVEIVNIKQIKE